MKRFFIVSLFAIFAFSYLSYSQYFRQERIWVGPTLGYTFSNLGYGFSGEYSVDQKFGIGVDLGYSSFSENLGSGSMWGNETPKFEYSMLGILFSASYHFTPQKKFDPFIKLGLGYINWDAKLTGVDGQTASFAEAYTSGVAITGQIGARYHFNQDWSARAAVGYPFIFSAGVDYAFGGVENNSIASEEEASSKSKPVVKEDKVNKSIEVDNESHGNSFPIYIGPYVGGNLTINTAVGNGLKPKLNVNGPEIGVSAFIPFTRQASTGFILDLGYEKIAYTTYPNEDENDYNTIREDYSFFKISPGFYLGGFTLGVDFGLPLDATAENLKGDEVNIIYNPKSSDDKIVDHLNVKTDVKIGGSIHLVNTETGLLNLNISASYCLNGLWDDAKYYKFAYEYDDNGHILNTAKSSLNPAPASLHLGLSYLFNVMNF